MTETLVKEYYTGQVRKEWRRLVRDAYHRLEFMTTLHFLEKYLPPQGLILDAGGGPGRYTLELARRGNQVVLLDMTPANLEFARRQLKRTKLSARVNSLIEGTIVDLSKFKDGTFDAVICLGGPLSHVLDAGKRDRAISELIRVAKNGAPVFVSVIGRLSLLIIGLTMFQDELEMPHFTQIRDTGDYEGTRGFTACHFFLPEELKNSFDSKGVTTLEMAGLEGISSHHRKQLNQLAKNELRWKTWLETHFLTCTHPSVVGISEHMLIVCRKNIGNSE
ncbi:MAG TPA: class I SAM-dependent methyltransferase [Anaerolineales bacterium]|nr:class I SAM-dependent methyltransferase [Anaerolineales bacterium]